MQCSLILNMKNMIVWTWNKMSLHQWPTSQPMRTRALWFRTDVYKITLGAAGDRLPCLPVFCIEVLRDEVTQEVVYEEENTIAVYSIVS